MPCCRCTQRDSRSLSMPPLPMKPRANDCTIHNPWCVAVSSEALLVEGPLVLEPLPVARHAGDLLAVEIRNYDKVSL